MAKKVLNPKALGLTLGIVWGAAAFLIGIMAMVSDGYGGAIVDLFGSIYPGYAATVTGSLIGGVWGFIDAGIGGYVVAWLYNKFA